MSEHDNAWVNVLCAGAVVFVSTVNMWKTEELRNLVPVDLTLLSIVLAGMLVAGALIVRRGVVGPGFGPFVLGFALFTPALLVTSFDNPYSVLKTQVLFTLTPFVMLSAMVLVNTHQRRTWFLRGTAALGVAVSALLLTTGVNSAISDGRLQLDDANPISVGRTACLGLVVLGIGALRWQGKSRLAAICGASLCAVAAAATGSRGPLVAAVAGIAIATVMAGSRRHRIRSILGLGLAGAALVEVVIALAPPSSVARLLAAQGGESDVVRGGLASETLSISWDNWAGVGWGDLGSYYSTNVRSDIQGWAQYPHNLPLEVLAEGGLIALIGLLILLVVSFRRLARFAVDVPGQMMLALWLLAVGSAMTSSDVIGNRIVWAMIGVGLTLPRVRASTRGAETPDWDESASLRAAAPLAPGTIPTAKG